jgi:hypothetical protein
MTSKSHAVLSFAATVLPVWLLAAEAFAQTASPSSGASQSDSAAKPSVPPAPVGHRQPRASDLPANIQKSESDAREEQVNRELNKKLRICRNC